MLLSVKVLMSSKWKIWLILDLISALLENVEPIGELVLAAKKGSDVKMWIS